MSTATSPEIPDDNASPRLTVARHFSAEDHHLEVFAKGRDGYLKHIWQSFDQCGTPCNCWTCSLVNGGTATTSISVNNVFSTMNENGRPIVFATGSDLGNIFFTSNCEHDPWWQPCIPLTNNF